MRRLKHRLATDVYRGEVAATFTSCIAGKSELFLGDDVVAFFLQSLRRASDGQRCRILIYCFMPEHLHVALQGSTPSSHLLKAIALVKQRTGYWLAHHRPGVRWQKGFFDHVLRDEEELLRHLRYIAENPVRRGLASDWRKYAFTGSDVYDLGTFLAGSKDPA
jgi:putative transposase